jgi:sulfate permease, SulP family
MSTVRRPSAQRAYLREVSKQTSVLRLQGTFCGIVNVVRLTSPNRLSLLWYHYLR